MAPTQDTDGEGTRHDSTTTSSPGPDDDETVLFHPAAPEIAAFDDVIDLTDRRRILLQMVFGVDVDDPDPIFERDS